MTAVSIPLSLESRRLLQRFSKDFGGGPRLVDAALGWAWADGYPKANGFQPNGRAYMLDLSEDYRLVPPRELGAILEASLRGYAERQQAKASTARTYRFEDKVRVDAPHVFFHSVGRQAFREGRSVDEMGDTLLSQVLTRIEERIERDNAATISEMPESHYIPFHEERYLRLLKACADRGLRLDYLLSWELYERT